MPRQLDIEDPTFPRSGPRASASERGLPRNWRRLCAFVLLGLTAVWVAAMLASALRWRFLDPLAGFSGCPIGQDFFQTPRGWRNLLAGNNIFLTEICDYGPAYATVFFNHPFVALAVGAWTAPLPPWVAFGVYDGAAVVLLCLGARKLARGFDDPLCRSFCYYASFCAVPVYVIFWQAQVHALVVLAVALVLAGLMGLEREPEKADRHLRWIQVGLLISLLSKPVVLVMLPVLFALPETRRKLLLPLAIYAAASLVFLLVPRLNPGGYNGMHWLYIPNAVFKGHLALSVLRPFVDDSSQSCWNLSLPMLLHAAGANEMVLRAARLPTLLVALMSLAPLILPDRAGASGQRWSPSCCRSSPTI